MVLLRRMKKSLHGQLVGSLRVLLSTLIPVILAINPLVDGN